MNLKSTLGILGWPAKLQSNFKLQVDLDLIDYPRPSWLF